ncbi:MAG: hypothetical protein OEZ39_00045 [Gammaproteobacteria bacterium]|nr:hypothetical protein [Gammaproteobacteria bacterium]
MNEIIADPIPAFEKPWYTLELTATGVGIDARLNDIYVDQDAYGGHSTTEFEVGTSIIDGLNEIKIIIYPFFNGDDQTLDYHKESEVKATLYVREKDNRDGKKYVVGHIHINPNQPLEKIAAGSAVIPGVPEPVVDVTSKPLKFPGRDYNKQIVVTRKTLPVKSPYPRWAWQDGQVIEYTKENFKAILMEYKKIYDAYAQRDMNTLYTIHAARARENAIAYYLGDNIEAGHKFMSTGQILKDSGARLDSFEYEGTKLDIYANGRMARIVDLEQYHPVLFVDTEKELVHIMKFGFYKDKAGQWVLIR